jgi:hypothetical protein
VNLKPSLHNAVFIIAVNAMGRWAAMQAKNTPLAGIPVLGDVIRFIGT